MNGGGFINWLTFPDQSAISFDHTRISASFPGLGRLVHATHVTTHVTIHAATMHVLGGFHFVRRQLAILVRIGLGEIRRRKGLDFVQRNLAVRFGAVNASARPHGLSPPIASAVGNAIGAVWKPGTQGSGK